MIGANGLVLVSYDRAGAAIATRAILEPVMATEADRAEAEMLADAACVRVERHAQARALMVVLPNRGRGNDGAA